VTVQNGAQFAQLLLSAFDAMVNDVRVELERAGHAGLTVANERAMQAIDGGAVSAASVARATGVTRQAAAKTISTLESLGYVVRATDVDDARQKSLTITAADPATSAAAIDALQRLISEARGVRQE
jgi:DNA-binding MarR family transcriptional regulator